MPAVMIVMLLLLPAALAATDWPQWRGPERNGVAVGSPPLLERIPDGLAPAWEVPLPAPGRKAHYTSPIIVGGTAVIHLVAASGEGVADVALAVDVATGAETWRFEQAVSGAVSKLGAPNTPCAQDGRVHVVGAAGTVMALDLATGRPLWQTPFPTLGGKKKQIPNFCASPLIAAGRLVVSGDIVAAFDPATGAVLW